MTSAWPRLEELLVEARRRGLLGPGPVRDHIDHGRALARLVGEPPSRFLDLGSGAGTPGLALALEWTTARGSLLDSRARQCRFLGQAVAALGLGDRVSVERGRAESLARRADLRARFDLVVARAFGPPAVTAECAAGFLVPGGRLLVSEPPARAEGRWPTDGLGRLGLTGPEWVDTEGARAAVLTAPRPVDERWPRRPGVPRRRPVW